MGCISSKFSKADLDQENLFSRVAGDYRNHVVSLTSSTYGALRLDRNDRDDEEAIHSMKISPLLIGRFQKRAPKEEPESINAWELMEGLDDEIPICSPGKQVVPADSPVVFKSVDKFSSLKKQKTWGKENSQRQGLVKRIDPHPCRVLKPFSSSENSQKLAPPSIVRCKNTPINLKIQVSVRDASGLSGSARNLSPFFDPELLAGFEQELNEEREQIKKMVVSTTPKNRKAREAALLLQSFDNKCPPGGEKTVVLYTTTLRGIRKTFEDCNAVRSAVESYDVQMTERDISMDSGFREELRVLMGKKEVRVPVVFVKGRLIGGAEEVMKLEEEGKLELLFQGLPRAAAWCEGCGGLRFVMCMDCNGSCKLLDADQKKMVKCGECNENGLIHCPICS